MRLGTLSFGVARRSSAVICSSLAREGARVTLAALEAGAVEIIEKPDLSTRQFFDEAEDSRFAAEAEESFHVGLRLPGY